MIAEEPNKIAAPYYPIVYVRGYAMRAAEREETFYDTYYGFSATSVEKRQAAPPTYFEADVFEGQLIRFMKLKGYAYADSANQGERYHSNPARSLWVCRFYDQDFMQTKLRSIKDHAEELQELVCRTIPERLKAAGVQLGEDDRDYRVILIAHSMGGLVCRTLIQNLLPGRGDDPKRWIHRLVTMGTPHKGIDLGAVPEELQNLVTSGLNVFDSGIFREPRMREYLELKDEKYDIHSLGSQDAPAAFPVKRCLCIIGSDHGSYNLTRVVTGSFSDGLVKQDHAYVVAGEAPANDAPYPEAQNCYWANVHRAHSGFRGIVNSYESFENIYRFLFGDTKVDVALERLKLLVPAQDKIDYFYDFEFRLAIRGSTAYLQRREQDPCENAIRLKRADVGPRLALLTSFLHSRLREDPEDPYSHFAFTLRVVERQVQPGFLWDHHYPSRPIYSETLEIRVGTPGSEAQGATVQYRWLSDTAKWNDARAGAAGAYRFDLRKSLALSGQVTLQASHWPDLELTKD